MTGSEEHQLSVVAAKLGALEQRFEEHRQEAKEHRLEAKEYRTEMKADMKEIRGTLQTVLDRLNGWQGGWKALAMVGAVMMALGGLIVRFVPELFKGHP